MKIRQLAATAIQKGRNIAIVGGVALTAAPCFADNSEAISAAVTSASTDVGTTTAGVISIAALGFGLGMIVSWLRK